MDKLPTKCLNCGKERKWTKNTYNKFCSNKCQGEFTSRMSANGWFEGKVNPLNTNGVLKPFVRKYMFNKYGNKCCICGWGEINRYTGKIPLEIDHIDGDYKNNNLENLRLICPNCHSLTSTYKNSNKGHGRERGKIK